MRSVCRILIVLLVVAVLPLRGYAAVAAELCAGQHGGTQAAHAADHDHGHESDHGAPEQGGDVPTNSICSHCASCTVGASLAPDVTHPVAVLIAGTDRIPFFDARRAGYVPDHLERPPLVS